MKRFVVIAAIALFACDSARSDAEQLVGAVDRFRRANEHEAPAMVAGIQAVSCTNAEICAARTTCLAFAEPMGKAMTIKKDVEITFAAVKAGTVSKDSPEAKSLIDKTDQATTLTKEGRAKLEPCDDQLQALKRKYRL